MATTRSVRSLTADSVRLAALARPGQDVKVANNTTARAINVTATGVGDVIEVRLHGHLIACLSSDHIDVRHCGYVSATTAQRLHALAKGYGWSIGRKQGTMSARPWREHATDWPTREIEAQTWTTLPRIPLPLAARNNRVRSAERPGWIGHGNPTRPPPVHPGSIPGPGDVPT